MMRSPRPASLLANGGLTGFGHSMGGTALLMAAHREPELFDTIVVYEPIVFDPDADRPSGDRSHLRSSALAGDGVRSTRSRRPSTTIAPSRR